MPRNASTPQPTKTKQPNAAAKAIQNFVRNPLYNILIHTLISFALMTVHNPEARAALKDEVRPLRDALDELYADETPALPPVSA